MTRHISNAIADPYFSFHKLFEFKGLNNIPNITFGYSDSEYFQKRGSIPLDSTHEECRRRKLDIKANLTNLMYTQSNP